VLKAELLDYLSCCLYHLTRGLYLYLISVVKTETEIIEETTFLFQNREGNWDDIKMIADRSPQIVPALLNWGTQNDRSAAKDFGKFYRKLDFAIMQTHRDLLPMTGADGTNFY
jgi:succinate dehydrogenase/fumarate reductase flavoprotein subunit